MPDASKMFSASVHRDLTARLGQNGENFRWERIVESVQATTYRIEVTPESGPSSNYVLKRFRTPHEAWVREAARTEFQALHRFSAALADSAAVTCPSPLAFYEDECAYLMTFSSGQGLDSVLAGSVPGAPLASNIVRGLSVYYGSVDTLYMDFHPGNVLVGVRGSLCFIDPTLPDSYARTFDAPMFPLGSGDAGYWIYTECAKAAKRCFQRSGNNPNRLEFLSLLLRELATKFSPTDAEGYVGWAFLAAQGHLSRLRCDHPVKGRILYPVATWYLKRLKRATEAWCS